ncbi:hypothetical protein SAMN04488038_101462 [Solimonas aquatica]|uniref:Lipoprotein n=1 Tax=Solimonas aquatica TaxID=489703 RepID=A0A1H9AMG4_9GAMM|nr:hypothetical protein [Solimonas aquatica]SEP77964.1 hypothetical protein SAMN04488038_101462 [Solimonas aquatica]
MKHHALAYAALPLLAACSLFNPKPDAALVSQVHAALPLGMTLEKAEETLHQMNFDCERRHGAYTDEAGGNHEDQRFALCVQRPTKLVSFACDNRNQVVLVPDANQNLAVVAVSRGPYCAGQ